MTHIFISYRRSDSEQVAGRIHDRLVAEYGSGSVFKDVDSIFIGVDFRQAIEQSLSQSDVFIAIIGSQWLHVSDESGTPRLQSTSDFVRLEIEAAFERDIPVIPVTVSGAAMPKAEDLPKSLQPLAYRHASIARADPDFHRDMDRLIEGINTLISRKQTSKPTKKKIAKPTKPTGDGTQSKRFIWMAVASAVLALLIGGYVFFDSGIMPEQAEINRQSKASTTTDTQQQPEQVAQTQHSQEPSSDSTTAEQLACIQARQAGSIEAWQQYQSNHPQGNCQQEANQQITLLKDKTEKDKVTQLLNTAADHMRAKRYTLPEQNNAFMLYQQVLQLDADNKQAQEGIQKITDYYLAQALQAAKEDNEPTMRSAMEKAVKVSPKGIEVNIQKLEERLQQTRKDADQTACTQARAQATLAAWQFYMNTTTLRECVDEAQSQIKLLQQLRKKETQLKEAKQKEADERKAKVEAEQKEAVLKAQIEAERKAQEETKYWQPLPHSRGYFVKVSAGGRQLPLSAKSWSCVLDKKTGLMWEVKTNDGGIHDTGNEYSWGGKGVSTMALGDYLGNNKLKESRWDGKGERFNDWNKLVNGSNSDQLCGKSDWRVPDLYELASLVHCSKGGYDLDRGCTVDGYKRPTIDTRYFPNTDDAGFWSASPDARHSYDAWYVHFGHGDGHYDYRSYAGRLRLVRGGQ